MLTWLVESRTLLSIVFGSLAFALIAGWWRTRKRVLAIGAGVGVVLIAALVLLAYFTETDSQRIENSVREMVEGLKAHNLDRIFARVSDQFEYHSIKKAEFRQKVSETMRAHDVTGAEVWDFQDVSRDNGTAQVQFRVRPLGNWDSQGMTYRCLARFVLDPDGEWRLKGFQIFAPVGAREFDIPGY
jgi:hypothetical protein